MSKRTLSTALVLAVLCVLCFSSNSASAQGYYQPAMQQAYFPGQWGGGYYPSPFSGYLQGSIQFGSCTGSQFRGSFPTMPPATYSVPTDAYSVSSAGYGGGGFSPYAGQQSYGPPGVIGYSLPPMPYQQQAYQPQPFYCPTCPGGIGWR